MKIKVIKRDDDIVVEYFRVKDVNSLRYGVLNQMVSEYKDSALLFIDTNNRVKDVPFYQMQKVLDGTGLDYVYEPVSSSRRGAFGFTQFLKTRKKDKRLPENIFLVRLKEKADLKELYDVFLSKYDYAVLYYQDDNLKELVLKLKIDVSGILFNKKICSNTLYDSIVAGRMRMDAPYGILEEFYEE